MKPEELQEYVRTAPPAWHAPRTREELLDEFVALGRVAFDKLGAALAAGNRGEARTLLTTLDTLCAAARRWSAQ
jgi:hypothetical protein